MRAGFQCKRLVPHILFRLAEKKKTVARRRKLCIARFHGGVKTYSRRCVSFPPHKRCAGLCGGFGASSKGLCAFPDAQPLTLAVCAAWRCHFRAHSVRLNGEKAENLLKRPALPRRTTRDSAMSPGLPGSAAERPERHKRPLDMKDLFLLYRVAAFFFS